MVLHPQAEQFTRWVSFDGARKAVAAEPHRWEATAVAHQVVQFDPVPAGSVERAEEVCNSLVRAEPPVVGQLHHRQATQRLGDRGNADDGIRGGCAAYSGLAKPGTEQHLTSAPYVNGSSRDVMAGHQCIDTFFEILGHQARIAHHAVGCNRVSLCAVAKSVRARGATLATHSEGGQSHATRKRKPGPAERAESRLPGNAGLRAD